MSTAGAVPASGRAPRAVVFDFGAVLFQWRPYALLQQTVPELAPDEARAREVASRIFESFTPDSDWARFDLGQLEAPALAQRIARRMDIDPGLVQRVIDAIPGHLQPQAATVELFHRLRTRGHRLYYLSNMPVPYAEHLERENDFIAQFADGIFSGRVGLMKPNDQIYELAEQRFGLTPHQTLFIDDHGGNVDAARARGWQAVRFVDAGQTAQEARALGWLE